MIAVDPALESTVLDVTNMRRVASMTSRASASESRTAYLVQIQVHQFYTVLPTHCCLALCWQDGGLSSGIFDVWTAIFDQSAGKRRSCM
jgi:hypothetical protein